MVHRICRGLQVFLRFKGFLGIIGFRGSGFRWLFKIRRFSG